MRTKEQLLEEWGRVRYVNALDVLNKWYLERRRQNLPEEILPQQLVDLDVDALELLTIRTYEIVEKLQDTMGR